MSRRFLVAAFALLGCTPATSAPGPAPAPDASALLAGCARETHDGATVWSCGEAFLVMDAPLPAPVTDEAVDANLRAFEAELVGEGTSKATVLSNERQPGESTRLRLELPEKGRFFAMMVIVRAPKPRALSCSARESEAPRCEKIVDALARAR